MTARRTNDDTRDDAARAATAREAKGSVQEAIGKLIGDDGARDRGAAERKAGADDTPADGNSPRR